MAEKKAAKAGKKEKAVKKGEKKPAAEKPKKEKKEAKKKAKAIELNPEEKIAVQDIVLFPLITEKAVGMIETQNKLTFAVKKGASKTEVKKAVEKLFGVKVDKVRILNDLKGRKKAIVSINKEFKADDIATKLGVI